MKASGNMFDRTQVPRQAVGEISSSAATDSSGMKFGGKPTFFNKAKVGNLLNKGEFPELGSFSEVQDKKPVNQEGKGNVEEDLSSRPFMSSAARPMGEGFSGARRDEGERFGEREQRPAASKPVFTSSKGNKNKMGGATSELAEIANTKQNYDMSFLGCTAKPAFVAVEGQEPRQKM